MFQSFIQAAEDCVLTFEGILSKEQFKHCGFLVLSELPVSISHCDLVKICQKCPHEIVGWFVGGSHLLVLYGSPSRVLTSKMHKRDRIVFKVRPTRLCCNNRPVVILDGVVCRNNFGSMEIFSPPSQGHIGYVQYCTITVQETPGHYLAARDVSYIVNLE